VKRYLFIPIAALALAGCGQSSSPNTTTKAKRPAPAGSNVAMTQRCSTADLVVWLGVGEGGATAGSTYYPLELTNVSNRSCRLFGFPVSRQSRITSSAPRLSATGRIRPIA
jgi:hypothetical protein